MPRTTAAEKIHRDHLIVADRARGIGWARIAERHRISQRQAQNIWREYLAGDVPVHAVIDPVEVMAEVLAQLDATVEDLALLAERTRNDSVRLGALKTRLVVLGQRVELLQVCGALPRSRRWNQQIEAEQMSRLVLDTLSDHDAPEALLDALVAALDAHLRRTGYLPEPDLEESEANFSFAG